MHWMLDAGWRAQTPNSKFHSGIQIESQLKSKRTAESLRLRLHLALKCDMYPDVVHIHIEKKQV